MKRLLVLSLACLTFVSATDKKEVNKRNSFGFTSGDIFPAVQQDSHFSSYNRYPYSTAHSASVSIADSASPITSTSTGSISRVGLPSYRTVGAVSHPEIYSPYASSVGLRSYQAFDAVSRPETYSSYFSNANLPYQTLDSAFFPTGYSAHFPTSYSGYFPTASSAPDSTIRSSFFPTAYSASDSYVRPTKEYKVLNKEVPVYVQKPVPYEVTKTVKVPTPYTVTVNKPYSVPVKVKVPVEIPKPYEVRVEHRVPVPVPERVPIEIPRPYPVYKTKKVQVEIEKPIYVREKVEVRYPVPKPYPVEVPTAVRVKVPQRVYLRDPQIVEQPFDRTYSVPNHVYGESYEGVPIPTFSNEKSILSSLHESKPLEESIATSVHDHGIVDDTLTQLSEQSLISSQNDYNQAVQGLENQPFEFSQGSAFGADYFPGFQQSLDSSINGLPSYEEYRRTHPADGVINDEKESITVESKSSTKESSKDILEARSGEEEPIVSSSPASPVENETTTAQEVTDDESTVPSKTTDIV